MLAIAAALLMAMSQGRRVVNENTAPDVYHRTAKSMHTSVQPCPEAVSCPEVWTSKFRVVKCTVVHRIRPGVPDDTISLAELAETTFRESFAADNTVANMDAYVESAFSVEAMKRELADTETNLFLVAQGDADPLVGYAKLRVAGHETVDAARPIELHRLYVRRFAAGTGLGRALLRSGLDAARVHEHDVMWLGVWEHNHRARTFYERWGFRVVGAQPFMLGSEAQTDLVMALTLTNAGQ